MYVYVELWKATAKWLALSPEERGAYLQKVGAGMEQLRAAGIEAVAWGSNDPATTRRAPYDFFAVWRMPSAEAARGFEGAVEQAGWFDYFDQIDVGGLAEEPTAVLARHVTLS